MKKFDSIVIGSGVAGLTAAYALKAAGKTVAIIEEDLWGGTCPNKGCDPKKILLGGVEARDRVNQLIGKGYEELPPMNWAEIEAFKREFTDPVPESRKQGFADYGIDMFHGTASFVSNNRLTVGEEELEAAEFLLATGQRSAILPIEGKEWLKTSTDFLALDDMPEKIIFIGAGYIAFELATIANAAGAEVHIIHHGKQPLKAFDPKLVDEMVKQLEARGITFHFSIDTQSVEKTAAGYTLHSEDLTLSADLIFCTAGRIPNVESLNLEKAGVAFNKRGIEVDDHLRTTNPAIFACGDVLDKKVPKLTPVSVFEGEYATKVMNGQTEEPIRYPSIPTIVYGSPKLAQVGMTTMQANEKEAYEVKELPMTNWFTYRRINEPVAKATLIFDEKKQLVGAATLSGEADELINYLSLVIDKKMTHDELNQLIMGYPTVASDLTSLV